MVGRDSEIELKLQVLQSGEWADIGAFIRRMHGAKASKKMQMVAVYYDTADGLLRKQRFAYRIRKENDLWFATLKGKGTAEGGLHQRLEYTVEVKSNSPDLSVFPLAAIDQIGEKVPLAGALLQPVLQMNFTREAVVFADNGQQIEVALDEGEICAAGKILPILEVELELIQGRAAALLRLGAILARRFSVVVGEQSKYARGLALCGGEKAPRRPKHAFVEGLNSRRNLLVMIYLILYEGRTELEKQFHFQFAAFVRRNYPKQDEDCILCSYREKLSFLLDRWADELERKRKNP